jgi:hypothetical protein
MGHPFASRPYRAVHRLRRLCDAPKTIYRDLEQWQGERWASHRQVEAPQMEVQCFHNLVDI